MFYLILVRWLQMISQHLLVENFGSTTAHWRDNPHLQLIQLQMRFPKFHLFPSYLKGQPYLFKITHEQMSEFKYPVSRATSSELRFVSHVFNKRVRCRVMIHHRYA